MAEINLSALLAVTKHLCVFYCKKTKTNIAVNMYSFFFLVEITNTILVSCCLFSECTVHVHNKDTDLHYLFLLLIMTNVNLLPFGISNKARI